MSRTLLLELLQIEGELALVELFIFLVMLVEGRVLLVVLDVWLKLLLQDDLVSKRAGI